MSPYSVTAPWVLGGVKWGALSGGSAPMRWGYGGGGGVGGLPSWREGLWGEVAAAIPSNMVPSLTGAGVTAPAVWALWVSPKARLDLDRGPGFASMQPLRRLHWSTRVVQPVSLTRVSVGRKHHRSPSSYWRGSQAPVMIRGIPRLSLSPAGMS